MDDLVERLRDAGYVLVSPGMRKLAHEAASRIQALETSLAEALRERTEARAEAANLRADLRQAEGRVIADVVAWLRNACHEGSLATALETGEWKK